MSGELKQDNPQGDPVVPEIETDMIGLMRKMQQQLNSLEKKIDSLMSRPQEGPAFHSFGRSAYQGRDDRPRVRAEYPHGGRERYYDKRESYRGREGRPGDPRRADSGLGHPYPKKQYVGERSHGEGNQSFSHKKKPFYLKRKERE